MVFQGRHQTCSGLHTINSGLLEEQGEEKGVCGLKVTDLQAQPAPHHVPLAVQAQTMSPFYQCHHPGPKHPVPTPGEQFCRECWHCPSSVSGGAGWGTRSHCTADKGHSQTVSSALGSVAVLKEAGCRLCKHSFAVLMASARDRGEVHHSPVSPAALLGCLDGPPTTVH